jgi:hypothetical protein
MPNDEICATATETGRRIKIKPEKGFLRLDKPFNDAVRAKKKSAVTNVLLRKELSGELAQRTATEILSNGSQAANGVIGNREMAGKAVRATVENAGRDRDTTLRRHYGGRPSFAGANSAMGAACRSREIESLGREPKELE